MGESAETDGRAYIMEQAETTFEPAAMPSQTQGTRS